MQKKSVPVGSGVPTGTRDKQEKTLSVFNRNPRLMECQAVCEACGGTVRGAEILVSVGGGNLCADCFVEWVNQRDVEDLADMMGFECVPAYDFEPVGDYGQDEEGWL